MRSLGQELVKGGFRYAEELGRSRTCKIFQSIMTLLQEMPHLTLFHGFCLEKNTVFYAAHVKLSLGKNLIQIKCVKLKISIVLMIK